MKLNAKELNSLRPVDKMKRTSIDNYNLVCEQNHKSIIFLFKYKSPITNKIRLLKLRAFDYQEIRAEDVKQLKVMETRYTTMVEVKGKDPIEKRNKKKNQKPKVTVGEIWKTIDTTIENLASNTQLLYRGVYHKHIKQNFGSRQPSEYTRAQVEDFIDSLSIGNANIAVVLFKKIEKRAVKEELIAVNRMYDFNTHKSAPRNGSDYFLNDDDLRRLFSFLDSGSIFPSLSNAIKMQLYTGCRVSEVIGATWDEIDLKDKLWTIPASRIKTERAIKNQRRPHVLPLTSAMLQILLLQKQFSENRKNLIFVSPKNRQIDKNTIGHQLAKAKLKQTGSHVLRKACGNWLYANEGQNELDIILNHKMLSAVNLSYADRNEQWLDKKQVLLNKWQNHLAQVVSDHNLVKKKA